MKLSRHAFAVSLAAAGLAGIAAGAEAPTQTRGRVARLAPRAAVDAKATAASYSVEVPYVQSYAPPNGGQTGTLVLNSAHSFNVTLLATDQHHGNVQGAGVALPQTDTFGYFSLPTITSNPSNPEVFVKILQAPTPGAYWVFYGHLTDLIYDLTVTENATGTSHTYHKNAGNEPGGFDTSTFASLTAPPQEARKATRVVSPNAYLRTSVDIANNTSSDSVSAVLQYCYTTAGAFQSCTPQRTISLAHYDNFHQDDIVGYLGSLGDLPQSAVADSIGTLLVTFDGLPTGQVGEGTVAASVYNRVSEVDPLRGTVGCGDEVSLFYESTTKSVAGTARDSVPAPNAEAGSISSTLGVRNTDVCGTGTNVSAVVTLYDPSTGAPVGNQITLSDIAPGELRLVDDLFLEAGVPTNVTTALVVADAQAPATATIEGFILDQDTDSLDTRFHQMYCLDGCFQSCTP